MQIVDERGRVGGRVNLIDAVVALGVLVLIPLAFGAYLLFRTPAPTLTSINPPKLYQGPNLRIEISGKNLRPFMRVSFNTVQGRTFLIGSTNYALIDLPDLEPGAYDVVLYDYMQEVGRLPKALTILPLAPVPTVDVEVSGAFKGIATATAAALKPGLKLPPNENLAEVLAVGAANPSSLRLRVGESMLTLPLAGSIDRAATLRVKCFVTANPDGSLRCNVSGPTQAALVAPGSMLTLRGPDGWLSFQIDAVHAPTSVATAQVRARFAVSPEGAANVKAGDVDADAKAASPTHAATILSVATAGQGTAAVAGHPGGARVVELTLRVPLDQVGSEWTYKEQPVKIGAPFTFETARYLIQGEVIDVVRPSPAPLSATPNR
jgi:hypothetical protein